MYPLKTIILWLALAFACFLPAFALTPSAPENHVWEIFTIGYDAPVTEATDLGNHTVTSTSDYDSAPIHGAIAEEIPTEANRALFGQNAEFKAAEGGGDAMTTVYRVEGTATTCPAIGEGGDVSIQGNK